MLRSFFTVLFVFSMAFSASATEKEVLLKLRLTDHYLGKIDAPVTFVEYSSISCPHCAEFHKMIFEKFKTEYVDTGKVLYIYRALPTNHPALMGYMMLNCVPQEKYFEYLNTLMKTQHVWAYTTNYKNALINIGKLGGLDETLLQKCFEDKTKEDEIVKDAIDASATLQITFTPTYYINGVKQEGVPKYGDLKKMIDDQISEKERRKAITPKK
jgi:protein-disulfide isomerase